MDKVRIESVGQMDDFDRIDTELKTLIGSIEGTIPGYRAFGMSADTIDTLQPDALYDFARDMDEKLETYIPEIQVDGINMEKRKADGQMELAIQIKQSDAGEVSEE